MDLDKTFIAVFTVECIFLAILFVWAAHRLRANEEIFEDAQKWRNGQQPIGRLISSEQDATGIKIMGTITDPAIVELISDNAGFYSVDPPPKPEWEVKEGWFWISREKLLDMSAKDWKLFCDAVRDTWVNMLRNDGYIIGDFLDSIVENDGGHLLGHRKVIFRVRVCEEDD